jgi:hypothetical protein
MYDSVILAGSPTKRRKSSLLSLASQENDKMKDMMREVLQQVDEKMDSEFDKVNLKLRSIVKKINAVIKKDDQSSQMERRNTFD